MSYPGPVYSYWPFLKRDPLSSIKMNSQNVDDCPVFDGLNDVLPKTPMIFKLWDLMIQFVLYNFRL